MRPAATIALIVVCAALYIWQHIVLPEPAGRELELAWGLVPDAFAHNPATLVSSMFLHLGLLHLAGNVLFLWVFGKDVEDAMGHTRFIGFYLLCGVLSALAYALANATSTVPASGASGAVSGVLGAYLLLFPGARVLLVLPLGFVNVHFGRFRAVWVLAVWFGLQILLGAILDDTSGGVLLGAVFAHVVGFVVGLALVTFFKRRGVSLWRRY
ncbi:MAG: rhomboid family intramembrane serine protease [Steroidobacteraceae bacterium]|nr:rhomboid family intramembrane serine protease [Steroidobacteraceae bacterium]